MWSSIARTYDGDKRGFTFEKYCQVHVQTHKDLTDYQKPLTESQKVRKFITHHHAQPVNPIASACSNQTLFNDI